MIEIVIDVKESRQRVDKFIIRHLPGAEKNLIFKQIRKKNITLNGKKISGNELLEAGDKIQFFFSDETYFKFTSDFDLSVFDACIENGKKALASPEFSDISVIYEDDNILLFNKPEGILSQSASGNELSLNDYLVGFLMESGQINRVSLASFKPSVLNRLDRNTSGIVICSKSLLGANVISRFLKDRIMHKYYLTIVSGTVEKAITLEGFHKKDEINNIVSIKEKLSDDDNPEDYDRVFTRITPIRHINNKRLGEITVIDVELITGKSHQIRAHLSSVGNPILGDYKYGNKNINCILYNMNIRSQMLHAYKLIMPDKMPEGMENLAAKTFISKVGADWSKVYGNMEEQRSSRLRP